MTPWASTMNVVGAGVQAEIRAGREAGLSKEAACLAALIGVLSIVRVEGLDEGVLLKDACKAVPVRYQMEAVVSVKN